MQKLYIISVVILFICSCGSNKNNEYSHTKASFAHKKTLFLSDKMQDTLMMFIDEIDSIPNNYNLPTNYIVEFTKKNKVTILKLKAAPLVYLSIPDEQLNDITWQILKGGCKIKNKNILIYSEIDNLSDFVNTNELSIEFAKDVYKLFTTHKTHIGGEYDDIMTILPISERIYKIYNTDSLELVSMKIGKFEKN